MYSTKPSWLKQQADFVLSLESLSPHDSGMWTPQSKAKHCSCGSLTRTQTETILKRGHVSHGAMFALDFWWLPKLKDFIHWSYVLQETLVSEPSVLLSFHVTPTVSEITKHLQRQSPSFPFQHEPSSDAQACKRASSTDPGRGYQGQAKEHPAQGNGVCGWVGWPATQTWECHGKSLRWAEKQFGDEFTWWVKDPMHPGEDRRHAEVVHESRGLVLKKSTML